MAKHAGGAPRTYDPLELAIRVTKYLETIADKDLPSVEGFCADNHISKNTVYVLAKQCPGLQDALDDLKVKQAKKLLNKSLNNEWNSTIAKLILSANHGMKETNTTELTGKNGIQLIPILGGNTK